MKKINTILFLLLALFISFNSINKATDGYFRHGYGVKYSALAGSGIAIPLGSMGAISNPAGLAFGETNYEINLALFSPSRDYTVNGNPTGYPGTFGLTPGKIESDSKIFFFPTLGGAWKINPDMAVGFAFYGNGGMNSNYPTATFYDPASPNTGVNIEQMFAAATYAYKFLPGHAVGVSAIYGFQRFSAQWLAAFSSFSSSPANLTGNSLSTASGLGAKIGYQGVFGEMLRAGAFYQSKIYMSAFDRYKGLFAEGGKFDVPASWSFGVACMPDEQWTILIDFEQIQYSGVKSVANPFMPNIMTAALGNDGGAGFGWKDMNVIKFGVMAKVGNGMTIMGGYSYGSQPIPTTEVLFNILAPAVVQHHITLGCTKLLSNNHEITLGLMYAPGITVSGANPLEAPGAQTIDLNMSQFQVEIGYAFGSL
jgi:long-chain fatty acid transport protein